MITKIVLSLMAICGGFALAFFGVVVLFSFHVWLGFALCVIGIGGAIAGTKIYGWISIIDLCAGYHGSDLVASG